MPRLITAHFSALAALAALILFRSVYGCAPLAYLDGPLLGLVTLTGWLHWRNALRHPLGRGDEFARAREARDRAEEEPDFDYSRYVGFTD